MTKLTCVILQVTIKNKDSLNEVRLTTIKEKTMKLHGYIVFYNETHISPDNKTGRINIKKENQKKFQKLINSIKKN